MRQSLVGTMWRLRVLDPPLGGLGLPACIEHAVGRKLVNGHARYTGRIHELEEGELVLVLAEGIPLDVSVYPAPGAVDETEKRQTFVKVIVGAWPGYMNRSYFNADSLWLERVVDHETL